MGNSEQPLDPNELMDMAERAAQLPAADAAWVARLFQEVLRARAQASEVAAKEQVENASEELDDRLAQLAMDTAEWLRTLWEVGYMGAGSFRSQPRSAFPTIDLEDIRKSSLFARIREGKHPLPFPPPTRHGLPWHELVDGEQVHPVSAELIRDEVGPPLVAIVDGCSEWDIVEELIADREYIIQHQRKGPTYRLRFVATTSAELQRVPPASVRQIHLEGHSGFHSYTLEWPQEDGETQFVTLRAATWERAVSEAERWLAATHPELYGQIRFERCEV